MTAWRTAYNAAFKAATERGTKPQAVKDGMSPHDFATGLANAAVTSSREFFSEEAQPSVQPPPSAGSPTFEYNTEVQKRVDAAKDNPAALAAIKQSLISKGIDPSTYGIE